MANWRVKLDVRSILKKYDSGIGIDEIAHEMAQYLMTEMLPHVETYYNVTDLENVISELRLFVLGDYEPDDIESFDDIMVTVYDIADAEDIWMGGI